MLDGAEKAVFNWCARSNERHWRCSRFRCNQNAELSDDLLKGQTRCRFRLRHALYQIQHALRGARPK